MSGERLTREALCDGESGGASQAPPAGRQHILEHLR